MSDAGTDPLVRAYGNRIGTPSSDGEAYGYWVFVLGVIVGAVGIGLVLISDAASMERGAGIVMGAIALVLLLVGPTIRLPIRRSASYLSYLGAAVCLAAAVWFVVAYPDEFGADFTGREVEIIGLYGLGVVIIALRSVLVPLATSLREERDAAFDRAEAAEREREAAVADAETERTASAEQRSEHNQVVREAERRARTAKQAREEAEQARDRARSEIDALRTSQSQFELYTDRGGDHRWRLRHRNHNITADSGQGYASADSRDGAVERLQTYADTAQYLRIDPAAFEIYRDVADEYRWRLRHRNGNVLADSGQGYPDRRGAIGGIHGVKRNAPGAERTTA